MNKVWPIFGLMSLLFLQRPVLADIIYEYDDGPPVEEEEADIEYPVEDGAIQQRAAEEEDEAPVQEISERDVNQGAPFYSRLPSYMALGEKAIIVDPHRHVWGAYSNKGQLIHAGLATSGSTWCPDLGRPCRTKVGSFRINSIGDRHCISSRYPLGKGGAPMPYCMYFNGNQGIHGSYAVSEGNHSHGCVRISVADAAWLKANFVTVGTKVVIMKY